MLIKVVETYMETQSAVLSGLIIFCETWQVPSEILKVMFDNIDPIICSILFPILAGEQMEGKQIPMCNACSSRGLQIIIQN